MSSCPHVLKCPQILLITTENISIQHLTFDHHTINEDPLVRLRATRVALCIIFFVLLSILFILGMMLGMLGYFEKVEEQQ